MTIRSGSALVFCALSAAFVGVEHHHHAKVPTAAGGRPPLAMAVGPAAVNLHTYADPASGIRFGYPSSWTPVPAKTAVLAVASPAGVGCASLCLDVPPMTWHPPMIPMGIVTSRYIDDLRREQIPDAQVQQSSDVNVSGASARRVTARGHESGRVRVDDAVILVHRGQIYILSTDSDDASAPAARAVLDAAVASVQWGK